MIHAIKCHFRLALDKSRTIIMSIHQPRYSIYKLFDSLTVLSRGELVYHGQAHLALSHFSTLGKKQVATCIAIPWHRQNHSSGYIILSHIVWICDLSSLSWKSFALNSFYSLCILLLQIIFWSLFSQLLLVMASFLVSLTKLLLIIKLYYFFFFWDLSHLKQGFQIFISSK